MADLLTDFSINETAARELTRALKGDLANAQKAIDELVANGGKALGQLFIANDLQQAFAKHLSNRQALVLSGSILGLVKVHEEHLVPYDLILESFQRLLETEAIENIDRQSVKDFIKSLSELLSIEYMYEIFKASELYFDIDEKIDSVRILTELRPIFSRNADLVKGYIIKNVIHLQLSDAGQGTRITFSLNANDINNLIRQLQRAKKKSATLVAQVKESGRMVLVQGSDSNGD